MVKQQRARRSRSETDLPTLEQTAAGFVNPIGVSRAGHGAFWVGLCFCAGVAILAVCFLVFPHLGETNKGVYVPPTHEPMPWQAWTFIAFFGLISLGITLFGLSLGKRIAVIEVDGDTLRIDERGLISRRSSRWGAH